MLLLLFLNCLVWLMTKSQINLYNTDRTLNLNRLEVDCLHHYLSFARFTVEKTEYCLGLNENNKSSSSSDFLNTRDQNFTFDELKQLHVTTENLLSWSAPVDLVEKYQYYIDHSENISKSEDIFFNCTKPWFGSQCQYSFDFNPFYSFQQIVQQIFIKRSLYQYSSNIISIACYVHLKCNRGGSDLCLDWREICDGRIDCIDEGADEANCFPLELNQCNENEYRCHNGQCIPKEFLENKIPYCLDQSDLLKVFNPWDYFPIPYQEDYEEYSCRSGYQQFVCGDLSCVADFDKCQNQRHILLIESISVQGNLSYTCWMMMICLTKILDRVNVSSCDQLFRSSNISIYLRTCEDVIQFPTVPVLFGHVRFLYQSNKIIDVNLNLSLTPHYICYDQELCDFLPPTYFHRNYTCRSTNELKIPWNEKLNGWNSVIQSVERYFRKCLIRYNNNNNNIQNDFNHPSLYCCQNSSKCISKHRILDGISDCYLNDDEEQFDLSCSIADIQRFNCKNETKCYSSLVSREICPPTLLRPYDEIDFVDICDRHVQMSPIFIDGENHTDETECKYWPCDNIYTRCDGFWSCSDGKDEENCPSQTYCPSHFRPCIILSNYTKTCLPANRVGDGHIDCIGAIDEPHYCRNHHPYGLGYPAYRCGKDNKCLNVHSVCEQYATCLSEKDDEALCRDLLNPTGLQSFLISTVWLKKNRLSLETSSAYPPSENRSIERTAHRSIEQHDIGNFVSNTPRNFSRQWRCYPGLYVRHWLGDDHFSYKCFCPPTHYGDQCQYQNQRVSFTAQVRIMNFRNIYAIILTLIDDNDDYKEIYSYQQITWAVRLCSDRDFHAYLLYPTRPKDYSKNYSVRVDVFSKTSVVTYIASWYFIVPFSFLPVNRMAVILNIPFDPFSSPSNCPLTCDNGKCMKYINKEKYFCQCDYGWSGTYCNNRIRCNDCSSDSICIGMIHNRSICVCPLNKGGPRCLIKLSCLPDTCENNATCIVLDDGMNEFGIACNCSEEYFGASCSQRSSRLEVSFDQVKLSSFVFIYTFIRPRDAVSFEMEERMILQKLTMFQHTFVIYTVDSFDMAFVQIDQRYYIAVLQQSQQTNISTVISPAQQCPPIDELLQSQLVALPEIRRIKHYHSICQTHLKLMCFVDKPYMCLCTLERYANCFKLKSTSIKCPYNFYCDNGGECLQDQRECPSVNTCNCTDCFFGDRCQFYAKGIGLTLDDILRYEIHPNVILYHQNPIVQWSTALIMILFVTGCINSCLSLFTFRRPKCRETGCGLYLFVSSITSLLTIIMFTVKCWFLLLTQINPSVSQSVLRGGCISLEFLLKVFLYMDNWLNACVAYERLMIVYKGISFNKMLSQRYARWVIFILPWLVMGSLVHEPMYRNVFDDKVEQRIWCVFKYSSSVENYNRIILLFHHFGPFVINIFSALFIIIISARRRTKVHKRLTYKEHLREQLMEHKDLIISPIILIILTIPRLIISFYSGCVKVSHNSWLYLWGYLISFAPCVSIFFVFVLPSDFYREQFKEMIKNRR